MNEIKVANIIAKTALDADTYAHTLRVVTRVSNEVAVVAYLHDVVEDSEVTLADLRDLGFDGWVVHAVETLTRRDSETYAEYIRRVAGSEIAKTVKLADLRDHLAEVDTLKPSLKERYVKAMLYLIPPDAMPDPNADWHGPSESQLERRYLRGSW